MFAFELMLIAGSVLAAIYMHGRIDSPGAVWKILVITALCQLSFYYHDLYDLTVVNSRGELFVRLLQASGAARIVLAVLYIVFPGLVIGRGVLAWRRSPSSSRSWCGGCCSTRARGHYAAAGARAHRRHRPERAHRRAAGRRSARLRLPMVGFVDDDPAMLGRSIVNPTVIGTTADIVTLVREHRVNRIVVGPGGSSRANCRSDALLEAKLRGVRIEEPETIYERLTGKIMLDELKPSWLIFSDGFRAGRLTRVIKRALDVASPWSASCCPLR